MNVKNIALVAAALCAVVAPSAAHAEFQADCNSNFWQIAGIDGPDQDKLILGMKARDWTKEDIDRLFELQEECTRNGSYPDSLKKATLDAIANRTHPNALRALEERDSRQQQAAAVTQRKAEEVQHLVDVQRDIQQKKDIALAQQAEAEAQQKIESAKLYQQPHQQPEQPSQPQVSTEPQPVPEPAPESPRQQADAEAKRHSNMDIVIGVIVAALGGWIWNKFIRNRCPNCKSTSYNLINAEEIDRWRGTKKITETHSRGTNTRHVQTTYVRTQFEYQCKHCQHEWIKTRQEELGSPYSLPIVRFFFGY